MNLSQKLEKISEELAEARAESAGHSGTVVRTLGWFTAGAATVALGVMVGRELRQRYRFNRRTVYDYYSHAGDNAAESDSIVGV